MYILLDTLKRSMMDSSKRCGKEAQEQFVDSFEALGMCLFGVISMAFLISQDGIIFDGKTVEVLLPVSTLHAIVMVEVFECFRS